jgi:hypothetical protein
MNNQDVLDNAPEGATHWDGAEYLNTNTNSYWRRTRSKWVGLDELILEPDTRSLVDIKRIAELEVKQRDIVRDIKVCFGYAVACDNNLLVNADAYNLLVATCNRQALKDQGK